jgi:LPXTG-motif cell wall-anchored protein
MPEFMMETWFMALMALSLVGLIIFMFVLRKKRDDDDE